MNAVIDFVLNMIDIFHAILCVFFISALVIGFFGMLWQSWDDGGSTSSTTDFTSKREPDKE